jgi:hypothetical protein
MNQIDPGGKSDLIQGAGMFVTESRPAQSSPGNHSILRTVTTTRPNLISECTYSPRGDADHWPESESTLELALIYEDARTEAWTRHVTESLTHSMKINAVHDAGWRISDLSQTEELSEAVSATSRADVIVTALYAAEELPLGFYSWVDGWLLRRPLLKGVFVALVAALEGTEGWCEKTENYLGTIARRGALEPFIGRCELRKEGLAFPAPRSLSRSTASASLEVYEHWGLNE